jgi:hypothetical protein
MAEIPAAMGKAGDHSRETKGGSLMNEEERIKEIRQRTEAATAEKEKGNAIDSAALSWAIVQIDVPYLLDLIESLQGQLSEARTEIEQRNLAGDFTYVIGQFTMSQGENGRLKGENRKLKKELSESQRREKAAVVDLKLSNTRKFNNPCEICRKRGEKCAPVDLQDVCRLWEWRGPQDEKGEKE